MITRGIKHDAERFIEQLANKYLPFKVAGNQQAVQCMVRPIQMWEVVYPRECHDTLCSTLFGAHKGIISKNKPEEKKRNRVVALIRKALGVQKLEYTDTTPAVYPLYGNNVEKVAIGQKDDKDLNTEGL